jgi:AraC-like DNA-binding protein
MVAWGAEAQGLTPARVLAGAGVDPAVLEQRGARIPLSPVLRAWQQIIADLRDPQVGLRFVEALPFGTGGVIDYLGRSAPTMGESLRQVARYAAPLMNQSDRWAIAVSGQEASLRIRTGGDGPNTELLTGLFATRSRRIYGPSWKLRSVSFAHPRRGPMALYERVFQVPVRFEMPFSGATFDRDLLDLPMPDADANLNALLRGQADDMVAALAPTPAPSSFLDAVEEAITRGLAEGDATLTRVADQLRMSPRSVQRRLREAGVTHRVVLDRLRLDLAARALSGPELTQREIGRALGYAGNGAFHRAFKRWSGLTPGEARARNGNGNGNGSNGNGNGNGSPSG